MSIQSIVCPTDFSAFSNAAVAYASSLAADTHAQLHLVHVLDESAMYVAGYTGGGYIADLIPRLESESQRLLDETAPPDAAVAFDRTLLHGHPAHEILRFAGRERADLIVLGTHGRTGLSRLLRGSVAEAVVRGATCPVVTVKRRMPQAQTSVPDVSSETVS